MKDKLKEKIIKEEFKNKLYRRLKRYNIAFGCWDEVLEVLEQTLSKELLKVQEEIKKEIMGEIEGMKYKEMDFLGYDEPEMAGMRLRNLILSQILKKLKSKK